MRLESTQFQSLSYPANKNKKNLTRKKRIISLPRSKSAKHTVGRYVNVVFDKVREDSLEKFKCSLEEQPLEYIPRLSL
jgi:hypothetical protein